MVSVAAKCLSPLETITLRRVVHICLGEAWVVCIAHASSVLCRLSSGMRVPLLSDSRLVYLCIRVYASARDGITKFATNTVRQESFAVPLSGVMHTLERAEVTVD